MTPFPSQICLRIEFRSCANFTCFLVPWTSLRWVQSIEKWCLKEAWKNKVTSFPLAVQSSKRFGRKKSHDLKRGSQRKPHPWGRGRIPRQLNVKGMFREEAENTSEFPGGMNWAEQSQNSIASGVKESGRWNQMRSSGRTALLMKVSPCSSRTREVRWEGLSSRVSETICVGMANVCWRRGKMVFLGAHGDLDLSLGSWEAYRRDSSARDRELVSPPYQNINSRFLNRGASWLGLSFLFNTFK